MRAKRFKVTRKRAAGTVRQRKLFGFGRRRRAI
jgi:hypothetical protein